MHSNKDPESPFGRTLGTIVEERLAAVTEETRKLKQETKSLAFATLSELVNDWLLGKVEFFPTGKQSGPLDPQKTLERVCETGFSVDAIQDLEGKPVEEKLLGIHETVVDLVYLLLKGAVAPAAVAYVPPGFKDVRSLLDKEELRNRFPEIAKIPDFCEGGEEALIAIFIIDAVVLIIDAVQFSD